MATAPKKVAPKQTIVVRSQSNVPTAADFRGGRVTNASQSEVVRQRLYDYQIYPGAGSQQLSFFQSPIGQGITSALGATAGTSKTQWDTSMQLGGQLPSGVQFLIDSIEICMWPGSVSTANTYTPANLSFFNTTAAAAVAMVATDANTFYQSGLLELNILQKNYLRETPLAAFPPKSALETSGALASNAAATAEIGFAVTKASGRPYYVEPRILLQPAVNFEVLLKWPAVVPLPSGFNARVGVVMDGFVMRASQ